MVLKTCPHFFSKLFAYNVHVCVIMGKRQLEIPNSSLLYTSCPDDSECEHGTWGLVRVLYCRNFPITYKKQLRKRNFVLPFLDSCLVTHSFFITERQPVSPKPPTNASTVVRTTPSSPSTRKFIETWKFNRPWLRYDPKSKLMFCDICVSVQVVNSFNFRQTI
jgi:hypothetical protein